MIALAVAFALVYVYVSATSGPDRLTYAAMYDFGDSLLFLAIFGVAALPPTGAALFFLRPYPSFWKMSSMGALAMAVTAVAALFACLAPGAFRYLVGLGSAQSLSGAAAGFAFPSLGAVRSDAFVQARICDRHRDRGDALRLRVLHMVLPVAVPVDF